MILSYRRKLESAFVALGLAAIGITGWEASSGAANALERATYDRLAAIRQTKARQVERYFRDLRNHVLAFSADESTVDALARFSGAWDRIPPADERQRQALGRYYDAAKVPRAWLPATGSRAGTLQYFYLAASPHPDGAKDLLTDPGPGPGPYRDIHARYHPTFHRYRMAFDFYDIFLISAAGDVLYTVSKEVDLGVKLRAEPYRATSLARVFERARALQPDQDPVIADYTPYFASGFAPAAFVAAPVRLAGDVIGVLAIQISIQAINDLMNQGMSGQAEGLGDSGQCYLVGPDRLLRSDLRFDVANPQAYFDELAHTGIDAATAERIRGFGTAVLTHPVDLNAVEKIQAGEPGTDLGRNVRGAEVLRSHAPVDIAGLDWTVIAEMERAEALAPVNQLRRRILGIGVLIALVFFAAAGWLARSVTEPVLEVAATARKLGTGDLTVRVRKLPSRDEIGELAADFNRMAEALQRTTVSKAELEVLAGRLISAQEDERARIARELHDDLTQRLAALAIEAGRWERADPSDPNLPAGLQRIKQQMAQLSEEVRRLSRRLHPAMLHDLGLAAAVEAECRALLDRDGPPVNVRIEGDLLGLPPAHQLALYRMVQEALRNIHLHAGAEQVELELKRSPQSVTLRIRDDGRGFDRSDPAWRAGLGIASMEERTRMLHGRFSLTSAVGSGTQLQVELPLDHTDPTGGVRDGIA